MKQNRPSLRIWRWLGVGFLVAVVVVFVMFVAVVVEARMIQKRAEDCLAKVLAMKIGEPAIEEVKRLQIENEWQYVTSEVQNCSEAQCWLIFPFLNTRLEKLGLARRFELTIAVQVEKGKLVGRGLVVISYASGGRDVYSLEEIVAQAGKKVIEGPRSHKVDGYRITTDLPYEEWKRVYSVDLSCLSRLGGCEDWSKVVPLTNTRQR